MMINIDTGIRNILSLTWNIQSNLQEHWAVFDFPLRQILLNLQIEEFHLSHSK
jgi:hypothetical protein